MLARSVEKECWNRVQNVLHCSKGTGTMVAAAWKLLHCSWVEEQANEDIVDTSARFRNVPKIVLLIPGAVHEDAPLYSGRGSE